MDNAFLLQLFILQLIDNHPLLTDRYGLTRFFAKSAVLPTELYGTLDNLENQKLIQIKDIRYTVKYYLVTEAGKLLLAENYSLNSLMEYLHGIEETDFFITILEKIEERQ